MEVIGQLHVPAALFPGMGGNQSRSGFDNCTSQESNIVRFQSIASNFTLNLDGIHVILIQIVL